METTVTKKQTAFRLESDVLRRLKVAAKNENRSVNNFVENYLKDILYKTPNATTLAAMRECEENDNLETLDLDNFQAYVKSL